MKRGLLIGIALVACGGGGGKKEEPKQEAREVMPTLAVPPLGVASLEEMNYVWGAGSKAYKKAYAALDKDWSAVKAAAEETLAKDPRHLHAHHDLGVALAQLGDFPGAAGPLVTALAGDFLRWGPGLLEDKRLTQFFDSPHGKALAAAHRDLAAEVEAVIAGGIWLIGRRSTFKWPKGSGPASTRGELYAFDEESRRFLMLSHTDHQVAGWLRSPDGGEVALVGYNQAHLADPAPLVTAWVELRDARTWEPRGKRAVFKKVRAVAAQYGDGGQLLVETSKAQGRWATVRAALWSIDGTTGKAVKTSAAVDPRSDRVQVSLDETVVTGGARGIKLSPSIDDPTLIAEIEIEQTGRTISLPESGKGDRAVPRASPSGARVAFATWVDPCAEEDGPKPSLYVQDGDQRHHLLTQASRFGLRWLSDDRLLYEDGSGALRIWDATTRREAARLTAGKAGAYLLGVAGLSASARPICRKEPLAEVETEVVPEEPPPEEPPPLPPEE
jgi:hypothetical protein